MMPKRQQTVAADPPKQLPKSSIEWVDIKTLKIDKSYQREVNPRQVKRIVSDFQPEAYHPLLVGRRDSGADYVVDGLQRLTAGKKLKFTDVMCSVFSSDGRAHEAAIFGRVNKARTAITALNGYRAALVSGDEKTLAINKIIDRRGFKIPTGPNRTWPYIAATGTLYTIANKRDGLQLLESALVCVQQGWTKDADGLMSHSLNGVATFLRVFPDCDHDRLIVAMQAYRPAQLIESAQATMKMLGGSRHNIIAQALLKKYNVRLQTRKLKWPK